MNIVIREAKLEDWEEVWWLLFKRGATDDQALARERIMKISSDPTHYLPIALQNEKAIGYGWVQSYGPHLRSGQILHRFHDLYVLPEYRNNGIAQALFTSVKTWSEQNGASWLQWNANPTSSSFYEKIGYQPIPEEEEGYPFYEITFTS
ncbi:GNAT family N-acetyltransferase [Bacillus pinisoli]|uniref:GNAT family N-acetyltransferase n=1 Tax=Bacillus pinisoli TaxID=2901866 RepID=UPI001FF3CE5E|nr:GNAT family N-acetyltransferase [Bacillus pinisoli]